MTNGLLSESKHSIAQNLCQVTVQSTSTDIILSSLSLTMLSLRERLTYSLLGILPKSSVAEIDSKNNTKKKHKKKNKKNKSTKLNNHHIVEDDDEDDFVSVSSDKNESDLLDSNDQDNSLDDTLINVHQFQPINYQKQLIFNFENAQIGKL